MGCGFGKVFLLCVLLWPAVAAAPVAAAASLPDGRRYEMVSPPSKNGADVISISTRTRASGDGNAVAFLSLTGFGDVRGTGTATEYIGVRDRRTGNGWSTHAIDPGPFTPPTFVEGFATLESYYVDDFSTDLDNGVFLTKTPLTGDSPNTDAIPKLYLLRGLRAPGPKLPQLVTDCPACSAPLGADPRTQPGFAAASADYRHVIFESEESLTSDVPYCEPLSYSSTRSTCPLHLYEWADGTVRLAGVLPNGTAAVNSQAGGGASVTTSDTRNGNAVYTPNVISRDGSRIFFTVRGSGSVTDGALYMRVGNATATPSTIQLNASERTPPDPPEDARYLTATPDGTRVYFTSPEQLTNASGGGLYVYDASKPDSAPDNLTLLFDGSIGGVVGVSDDGSYVYFVTSPPSPRLMLWHDGAVHEIATVATEDVTKLSGTGSFFGDPKSSRVTPDGRHMTFVSLGGGSLSHSGVGDTCAVDIDLRCTEVYVYDATANGGDGALTCVSCRQPASLPAHTDASFLANVGHGLTHFGRPLNHSLSDDGRFVFFSTGERLVPEDANGTTQDAYEYDTVTHTAHLLSSGAPGASPAYFMDASANGHDAFFTTRDRLVGWDVDDQVDLYDARIGGGFPEPPVRVACTTTAGCRGPQAARNEVTPPISDRVSGEGNVQRTHRRRHCTRGRVPRKVHERTRCVRRRHATPRHSAQAQTQRSGRR